MPITLVFNVPVHVEINEDDRSVLSVKVNDEHADGPVSILDGPDEADAAEALARCATIADEASWPAWVLGL
jgi:hypothetical protein